MLTKEKYQELWDDHLKKLAKQEMPPYDAYLEREKLFEEYLKDITSSGKKIKYILVAEACPDGGVNYFYDINAINGQTYLNRAYNAIYRGAGPAIPWRTLKSPNDKINKLLDLASRGVILLDLFPFALDYSILRKKLLGNGITKHFWDGDIYSIKTQITALCPYLDIEWDLCLIAPPTVSCHIVGAYDAIDITPCASGIHDNTTFKSLLNNRKRGCDHKKVASDTSGNPNTQLIKVAFDLPL